MSIAGIRSSRGDGYETLVALDWALTVLSDSDYLWIEVDSVLFSVDDVVIGKADGTQICCQCKKNQTHCNSWTVADLADELDKAFSLLASNNNAEVRFYSRSPFGELAKLREYAVTQPDEVKYLEKLSKEHTKTDKKLSEQLATHNSHFSVYEFLCRTTFETSPELDRMRNLLYERLRSIASNPIAAYNELWVCIDNLGARMGESSALVTSQHRLTKEDLKATLQQAGAMLAPGMNLVEVRSSFASTSAIGRSWQRSIAGQRITNPVVNELLVAIDTGKRTILLTGLPGSGKTCAILALQELLEQRGGIHTGMVPLFIQAREFADMCTVQERHAQGLQEKWVEQAARMAEEAQVVVVIDSLDVLSIAREHNTLTYFLAQIDRLLLVPNITVVTACRDFDRHYDRRIAERQWDCELSCTPLSWESEVAPLLNALDIHTTTIDTITRELIQNPRELALFVELAQRDGCFNIVTSQALAQRYLDTIVRDNSTLGETVMRAIETVADEMLKSRSLAIPRQRYSASQCTQRALCSLNVLKETRDGKLIFGHQTLLDVLVISGAMRQGVKLNEFIQGLSPVPFVRPSIRSFIAYLATGERTEFRKQLRAVLTGSAAFHIRRLAAESFAEQVPDDDDWPLIRELRNKHREVFQVIYTHATHIDWHHFWLLHLVPTLIDLQDAEGLAAHVHQVSRWKNEDATGILQLWTEVLSLSWLDGTGIDNRLSYFLSEINSENLTLITPLLKLLINMPRQDYDLLGHTIARCVTAGIIEDTWLWRYVSGDISDDDVIKCKLEDKLRCQPHELEENNDDFLCQRMKQSTALLDLALESIEQWSLIISTRYGGACKSYHSEFLEKTSYNDTHTQHDAQYVDSVHILLGVIEAAIINHAQKHSIWWEDNRERLCFNREGALRYFAIFACTISPQVNIDLVGRMLCDKELLESDLSYELGTLMQAAFTYLDPTLQDKVMACMLTAWDGIIENEHHRIWVLKKRVELISTIPCYLRSAEAQAVLDIYKNKEGVLARQPDIYSSTRTASSTFQFEVFFGFSDSGVLRFLAHYSGYVGGFNDFPFGGEQGAGRQLREAASRQPIRFLRILSIHWIDISRKFRDDIMDGAATYLNHCCGNLQINDLLIDAPEASTLVVHILDELERHPGHWHHNRAASNTLLASAHAVQDTQNAARIVFAGINFANLREKELTEGNLKDLIAVGRSMTSGFIAEALMILANRFQESSTPFPELLSPALFRFSNHEHPAIRALILKRLPYLQSQNPVLGWSLFERVMQDANGLWQIAEHCLYCAYYEHFDKISPLLDRIESEGGVKDMGIWGRISALSVLPKHIDLFALLESLKALDSTEAWRGVASVWAHPENFRQHRDKCITGIEAGLSSSGEHAEAVAQEVKKILRGNARAISVPIELICLFFNVLKKDNESRHHNLFGFDKWLNVIAHRDPELAIAATEIYLAYVNHVRPHLNDRANNFAQLMTCLFAEAEEREESDGGKMLQRVVSIQDALLSLGLDSISVWLNAAERL